MREIQAAAVTDTLAGLFEDACHYLPPDVICPEAGQKKREVPRLPRCAGQDPGERRVAGKEMIPLCQDTGAAVVMLELGQEAHVTGGDLYAAVNEGVRRGYDRGYLRKSIADQGPALQG
jgi:fumarate hydratase subunit alpha